MESRFGMGPFLIEPITGQYSYVQSDNWTPVFKMSRPTHHFQESVPSPNMVAQTSTCLRIKQQLVRLSSVCFRLSGFICKVCCVRDELKPPIKTLTLYSISLRLTNCTLLSDKIDKAYDGRNLL